MLSSSLKLAFSRGLAAKDVQQVPCLIVGLAKNIGAMAYDDIKVKLQQVVPEQEWESMMRRNGDDDPASDQTTYLHSNKVIVSRLSSLCSRHNAPARPHAITKALKKLSCGKSEDIVIVCEKKDLYAAGCAVVRAYSTYNMKTTASVLGRSCAPSKAASSKEQEVNVEFVCVDGEQVTEEDLLALEHAKEGIQLAMRIVDAPCNEMHTDAFLDEVRRVGQSLSIRPPTIIQGEELKDRGFGGIYGVGKAAVHQPALAVLSHTPPGATKTVAWVGKGIVYDTGGLSIKGKTAMPGMKRDCGGAAGILGAFYAAVKQGFGQNLHAIFCLAENSVSDRSTRPDDIHTLYSGLTVEISNTDAEGRLVLSDGVAYARKDLGADIVVDMCTLTGAQGIATGLYHAAHLTNDESWEGYASAAGRTSGDLSFPIVYTPELHFDEFRSAVADMKNSVANRSNALSSCAGLFINAHLGFDFPGVWLHVDMASPVHSGERATGYGVALLNTLFGNEIKSEMLKKLCPLK